MLRRPIFPLLALLAGCASPPPAVLPAATMSAAAKAPYLDPYCTASLGRPDCWRNPQVLPNQPAELADVPHGAMPASSWSK
jgi:hypothetical protein